MGSGSPRIKLLVNPTAGALGAPLERLPEVTARLAAAGLVSDIEVLTGLEAAPVLAQRAAHQG